MPRHHVLTRLARYFSVLWVDPPKGWREILTRRREHDMNEPLPQEHYAGFHCHRQEAWLPLLYRPAGIATMLARQRLKRGAQVLRTQGVKKLIVYLWRPEFEPALDILPHDLSCYHIDDEYSFAPEEQPLDEQELRVIRRVSQVFIHSPALLERKGGFNPQTFFVPNGVDYQAFAADHAEPAALRSIPRPRIGYVGNVKVQLDIQLLLSLAERHPTWSFIFVGPIKPMGDDVAAVEALRRYPNVHCLGYKTIQEIGAYPQHMDVCILPYRMNDYTKYIYPLKLHEYLAAGRPVVASPIRSLEEFDGLIRLAVGSDAWSDAIAKSLGPNDVGPEASYARRMVAAEYDWNKLVDNIAHIMCASLGLSEAIPFSSACPRPALQGDPFQRVRVGCP